MKKLMILASSLAMAFAVNAASATWGFTSIDIMDRNGEDAGNPTAMTAFLYLGTATTTATTINLSGLTLLATAGQNDDFTFGAVNSPVSLAGLAKDDAGQAYTLLLVEGDGLTTLQEGSKYWMVAATGTGAQATDPMSGATWATFTDGTAYGAGSWGNLQVGAVPEPTSDLLLLLGMAGLALKRKHA